MAKKKNLSQEGRSYEVFQALNNLFFLLVLFVTAYPIYYVLIASFSSPSGLAVNYGVIWLPIKPGTELFLLLGVARQLIKDGVAAPAGGLDDFAALVAKWTPEKVCEITGLMPERFTAVVDGLKKAKKPLVVVGSDMDQGGGTGPVRIGMAINGCLVYPSESIAVQTKSVGADYGIIAVPAAQAQAVCDRLVEGGVRAILCFAPVNLNVPRRVVVRNMDIAASLLLASWVMVLRPLFRSGGDDLLGQAISLAYPIGDVVVGTLYSAGEGGGHGELVHAHGAPQGDEPGLGGGLAADAHLHAVGVGVVAHQLHRAQH